MTAPDTTGGELREAIARGLGEAWITSGPRAWEEQSEGRRAGARSLADAVLALPALRELIAERDTLAAQVRAVEDERQQKLIAEALRWLGNDIFDSALIEPGMVIRPGIVQQWIDKQADRYADGTHPRVPLIRRALGTPTTGGGE